MTHEADNQASLLSAGSAFTFSLPNEAKTAMAIVEKSIVGKTVEATLEKQALLEKEAPVDFAWTDALAYARIDEVKSGDVLLAYVQVGSEEYALAKSERGRFALMIQRAFINSLGNFQATKAGLEFTHAPGLPELASELGFSYSPGEDRPAKAQFVRQWLAYLGEQGLISRETINWGDEILLDHIIKVMESAGKTYATREMYVWPTQARTTAASVAGSASVIGPDGEEIAWPGGQADLAAKFPFFESLFQVMGPGEVYNFVAYVIDQHFGDENLVKLVAQIKRSVLVAHQRDASRYSKTVADWAVDGAVAKGKVQAGARG